MVEDLSSRYSAGNQEQVLQDLKEYTSGRRKVPVPTYFTGLSDAAGDVVRQALEDAKNHCDLHCLGIAGLQKVNDINIAFLHRKHSKVKASAWNDGSHLSHMEETCHVINKKCKSPWEYLLSSEPSLAEALKKVRCWPWCAQ